MGFADPNARSARSYLCVFVCMYRNRSSSHSEKLELRRGGQPLREDALCRPTLPLALQCVESLSVVFTVVELSALVESLS